MSKFVLMFSQKDHYFMEEAIGVARQAVGLTSPNPAVGAVIVQNGKIVGKGHTQTPGNSHAEIMALKGAKQRARGARMYVTLEPHCFSGRTPPCTDAIVSAGISRVVVGMKDPNNDVNGKGLRLLKSAGIDVAMVKDNYIVQEIRLLNQPHLKYIQTGLPYVVLKAGVSLDGKIATRTGESQWITGPAARNDARLERSMCDAVVVGVGTVNADNPGLGSYGKFRTKKLLRVIIDPALSSHQKSRVFRDEQVLVVHTKKASPQKIIAFTKKNIPLYCAGTRRVSWKKLFDFLGRQGVRGIFVEGGAGVHGSLYDAFLSNPLLLDRVLFYIAPKIIGGKSALSVVGGNGTRSISSVLSLTNVHVSLVGSDMKVDGVFTLY